MRYIKESKEIDLIVDQTPLTDEERERISMVIELFKSTGKKPNLKNLKISKSSQSKKELI